jgi:putative membrane protein
MGAADAVPGVSGGTVALITGIYERLIDAITAITVGRLVRLLRDAGTGNRARVARSLGEIDIRFLLALGGGIATAVITVLQLVNRLLAAYPIETYGLFLGLIAASAVVLYRDISPSTPVEWLAAVGGFLLAFLSSGYAATELGASLPVIFVAGSVAISAMLLPGISGALLLLILGQYEYISGTLDRFIDAILDGIRGGGVDAVIESAIPVVTFLLGATVGLFSVAHGVQAALERNRRVTLTFLVSLIVGALRAPVERATLELGRMGAAWTVPRVGWFVVFGLLGATVVLTIEGVAGRRDRVRTSHPS